jgi:hypothetical protein
MEDCEMKRNTVQDLWKSIEVSGLEDCWYWLAAKTHNGYGRFKLDGKTQRAHRVAYVLTHGNITKDALVLHMCDTPACCNPSHLFQGTTQDNMTDKINKGRAVYAVGAAVGGAKLDADKVLAIRNDCRFQKDIAKEYGVSQTTVSRIKNQALWSNT